MRTTIGKLWTFSAFFWICWSTKNLFDSHEAIQYIYECMCVWHYLSTYKIHMSWYSSASCFLTMFLLCLKLLYIKYFTVLMNIWCNFVKRKFSSWFRKRSKKSQMKYHNFWISHLCTNHNKKYNTNIPRAKNTGVLYIYPFHFVFKFHLHSISFGSKKHMRTTTPRCISNGKAYGSSNNDNNNSKNNFLKKN